MSEPKIVFRCCAECGSAEEVLASTLRCPGCGTPYVDKPVEVLLPK